MKRNDLNEAKRLDQKALQEKVKALRAEMSGLVLDKHMNKLKDLKIISRKKKEVAQFLTILKQKELMESLESKIQPKVEEKKS